MSLLLSRLCPSGRLASPASCGRALFRRALTMDTGTSRLASTRPGLGTTVPQRHALGLDFSLGQRRSFSSAPRLHSAAAGAAAAAESSLPPPVTNLPEFLPDADTLDMLNTLSEPTLQSLGLGLANPFWAPGLIQAGLEAIHVNLGVPWWGAIVIATFSLRALIFPLLITVQRQALKNQPLMEQVKAYKSAVEKSKSPEEKSALILETNKFMTENNLTSNMFKSILPMLGSGAVFCSMFVGLRGMANLPVESMKTQGLYWFTDLTVTDPYFILPFVTCASMFVQFKVGADGMDQAKKSVPEPVMKFLKIMPFITFPVMAQFPAALVVYWCTTNSISICQTFLMKQKGVKKALIGEAPEQMESPVINVKKIMEEQQKNLLDMSPEERQKHEAMLELRQSLERKVQGKRN